jgi:hypothetical protein
MGAARGEDTLRTVVMGVRHIGAVTCACLVREGHSVIGVASSLLEGAWDSLGAGW